MPRAVAPRLLAILIRPALSLARHQRWRNPEVLRRLSSACSKPTALRRTVCPSFVLRTYHGRIAAVRRPQTRLAVKEGAAMCNGIAAA
ncbi:hypothetical protein BJY59DRAFT_694519 [Rhodotorula toruloides]